MNPTGRKRKRGLSVSKTHLGTDDSPATAPTRSLPVQPSGQWRTIIVSAALAVVVLLVFGRAMRFGFVNYDDDQYVYENGYIAEGLTSRGLAWMMTHHHVGNWHPLTTISHMVDCNLFGLDAGGHHAVNILLHAATSVLLLRLLLRMTGHFWPSAVVAALFAIHPLHVETVVWISDRKGVLSGLFFVLTLLAYERYARGPFSIRRYLWVLGLLALGLMSKPMLVSVPFLLLLLDYWPLRRWDSPAASDPSVAVWRRIPWRLFMEKVPFVLLTAAFAVVTLFTQQITIESTDTLPMRVRIANALVAYVTYLGKSFWPFELSVFYPHPRETLPLWKAIAAFIVLAGMTMGAIAARRRHPYLLAGWLWYLGTLVPVIGLVQVGSQALADRYTYLPLIGFWIALAWGASSAMGALSPRFRTACATAVVAMFVLLSIRSIVQVSYWKDSFRLFRHALDCNPRNYTAHLNLANALAAEGNLDRAIEHYRAALDADPNHLIAMNNLGFALTLRGRWDEGMAYLRRTIERAPAFAQAHYNVGNALAAVNRLDEAIESYRTALKHSPDYVQAHNNLGATLDGRGQTDEAIEHYRRALALRPKYSDALFNYGNALARKGQLSEAEVCWRKAIAIQPRYAEAHVQLGTLLYNRGQVQEGIGHVRRALEINPNDQRARHHLQVMFNGGQ